MGGLPLPKFKRCCFCTRKLKVACILITLWCMFSTVHSSQILFNPSCYDLYMEEGGKYYHDLTIIKWVLFCFNMLVLACSFVFLLGLFMGYRITADLFMAAGISASVTMIVHAVFNSLQMVESACTDMNDPVVHIFYFLLWIYFILIVNSHRDNMTKT